jgi:CubicO group peptidase (beta-lactamase class C family)
MRLTAIVWLTLLPLLIGFTGCGLGEGTTVEPLSNDIAQDTMPLPERSYWPTNDWRVSTPEEQGIDSERLDAMVEHIEQDNIRIDGVLVVRHGYLVLEEYIGTYGQEQRHNVYSCTKSIVSALVGIAIDKGYIDDVGRRILDFFPERSIANLDGEKEGMTLKHLLTMTSGMDARDSWRYNWRGLNQMRRSDDWVQYVLDLPMREAPGIRFEYSNCASFLLTAIIQETAGLTSLEFAEKHLFGPLGISSIWWQASPQGINLGYSEIHMTPRDMAKIGYLYLNQGSWNNEQVVPATWVEISTTDHSPTVGVEYGYQWWVNSQLGYYNAMGYGGQKIYVVPRLDMVVVFTSSLGLEQTHYPDVLLASYIIPSVQP